MTWMLLAVLDGINEELMQTIFMPNLMGFRLIMLSGLTNFLEFDDG